MSHPHKRMSEQTQKPATRFARNGAQATAQELREFLGGMEGRSPQQMLGELAGSSLFRCMLLSTVLTFAFLAVFTIVPYSLRGAPKKPEKPAAPAAAAPQPAPPAAGQAAAATAPAAGDTPSQADIQKAAEKMDLIESKPSDPKSNPLDKDLDKLLDVK